MRHLFGLVAIWQLLPCLGRRKLPKHERAVGHAFMEASEGNILGLEGQDAQERERCMKDKVQTRPHGVLTSFGGVELPAPLKVESNQDLPQLRTSECEPNGCGLWNFTNPWTPEKQFCVREVPKLLHFVWLDHPLKEKYAGNIAKVMRANPEWRTILWVNEEARKGLSKFMNSLHADEKKRLDVKLLADHKDSFTNWDIITKEPNVGARSDWIRLEVVNLLGGVYMDTDVSAAPHFSKYGGIFRWPFVAYSDFKGYGNLCNCIFGAEKQSPLLKLAFEGWRQAWLHHGGSSGPVGCLTLTAAFRTYNSPEILMLHQKYMFMEEMGTKPVMSMSFDATWRTDDEKVNKEETKTRDALRSELLKKEADAKLQANKQSVLQEAAYLSEPREADDSYDDWTGSEEDFKALEKQEQEDKAVEEDGVEEDQDATD